MCVEVFAVPSEPGKIGAKKLSEISGLVVQKREGALHFSRGGCSCSLLADGAGHEGATWALDPSVLEGLALALEALNQAAKGFTFQATWLGDEIKTRARVPVKAVLRDVRSNRIKNHHVYQAGRAG